VPKSRINGVIPPIPPTPPRRAQGKSDTIYRQYNILHSQPTHNSARNIQQIIIFFLKSK